ncbi:MAG: alpha/beta fold hydrolase [Armatimonadetes bacterium]|nr:alpha/beta fold hydrolase [Armatimonadota bacterium]
MWWLALPGGVLLYLGGCWVMARAYVSPVRLSPGPVPSYMREVLFAGDGYSIPAWRGGSGQDVYLCVHGYGGCQSSWNALSTELVPWAEVVAIATMGQTRSPAKGVGFGEGEAIEVIAVAEALAAEGKRIHLAGVSMGGAACWIAAGSRPDLFASVTTEAAFARLDWASEEFLSVSVPFGATIFRPIILMAERSKGIRGHEVRPADAAASWKGPCLILQSRDDGMFSPRHAEALSQATSQPVWWFEGLKHGEIFLERAPEVARTMLEVGGVG